MPENRSSGPAPNDRPSGSRVVIVGAGQTGRELARQLCGERNVAIVDLDPAKLDRVREDIGENAAIRLLARDGTSALTLREAGAAGADWVVAATDNDSVNIEVCRVAATLDPEPGAIGTLRESGRLDRLRATGADTIVRPLVIAHQIRNRIELSHQVATTLGLGRGEIREIQVLPTSPAIGVPVRDLGARGWLIAGIYRADRFHVPHGDAVIGAGDRLLITGEPEITPGAAEFLREGKPLFPLRFGTHIVVLAERPLPDLAWKEAQYLFQTSQARGLRIVAAEGVSPPDDFSVPEALLSRAPLEADGVAAARRDAGCVVFPRGEPSLGARLGLSTPRFLSLLARFPCPVLLPGGTFPWNRIVVPITERHSTMEAAGIAFGLARQLEIPLMGLDISPPAFISESRNDDATEATRALERMAELHRARVAIVRAEGNPARRLPELTGPNDLLVIGYSPRRTGSFLRPDTAAHMMLRATASVLAIPLSASPPAGGASAPF